MRQENDGFSLDLESFLATIARIFARLGAAREVSVLANSHAKIQRTGYESSWDGDISCYTLYLEISSLIYGQIEEVREEIEEKIKQQGKILLRAYPSDALESVIISPPVSADKDWRDKARAWVNGAGINNQGRVRSDNIASKSCDGLLFRSEPEILLYQALKSRGVSFAPLPVFVRGGEEYRRIEPDFVILKDGIVLIIEVDGDTVHHETPVEAHNRTTMLVREGAYLERIKASECDTSDKANICAEKLLKMIAKYKAAH